MGNLSSEITSPLANRSAGTNFVSLSDDLKLLKSHKFKKLNDELSRNPEFQNKRKLEENCSSSASDRQANLKKFVTSAHGYFLKEKSSKKTETFSSFEAWVGRVEEISHSSRQFQAILQSNDNYEEVATFSFDDVSEDDVELLKLGAVFYWNVGQVKDESGRISNVSTVRFRRLQHWKRNYLEERFVAAKAKYNDWL